MNSIQHELIQKINKFRTFRLFTNPTQSRKQPINIELTDANLQFLKMMNIKI